MSVPLPQIAQARQWNILAIATRLGAQLNRVATNEYAGPCLVCGGEDRFSVNTRKEVGNCRRCEKGGDVIDLLRHVLGLKFDDAIVELAGGDPPPQAKSHAPDPSFDDDRNLDRAAAIWKETLALGDEAKAYFASRKIDIDAVPDHGGLRWQPRCWWGKSSTAPCVVARYTDARTVGQFVGARYRAPHT
jgi:hypothetical protein